VAGVDILRSNNGPVVMEVNSSPGLEGIEAASEIDVADAMIDYLEQQVQRHQHKTLDKNMDKV
jgi:ribosomal protein S6--L-glutamate ligase